MSTNTAEDEEEKRRIEALDPHVKLRDDLYNQLDKKDELIEAQKEYIEFISKEYELVYTMASVRGFTCSHESIAKGESLRKRILELTNKQS